MRAGRCAVLAPRATDLHRNSRARPSLDCRPGPGRYLVAPNRSIDADLQLAHEPAVFLIISAHHCCELLRSVADGLESVLRKAFANFCLGERLHDVGVEPRHDLLRRPCREKYALPLLDSERLEARLLIGRNLRQER